MSPIQACHARNQPIPITGRSIGASLVKEELNDDSCDSAPSGNTEKATQLLLIYFLTPWQHKTALWFAIRRCLNNTLFNYKLMTLCVLAFHLHNNGILGTWKHKLYWPVMHNTEFLVILADPCDHCHL